MTLLRSGLTHNALSHALSTTTKKYQVTKHSPLGLLLVVYFMQGNVQVFKNHLDTTDWIAINSVCCVINCY